MSAFADGRRAARKRCHDHSIDTITIRKNVGVPEPQHVKTLIPQVGVALLVGFGLEMLPAIHFDNQPRLEADEIDDVTIDRLLSAKAPSG